MVRDSWVITLIYWPLRPHTNSRRRSYLSPCWWRTVLSCWYSGEGQNEWPTGLWPYTSPSPSSAPSGSSCCSPTWTHSLPVSRNNDLTSTNVGTTVTWERSLVKPPKNDLASRWRLFHIGTRHFVPMSSVLHQAQEFSTSYISCPPKTWTAFWQVLSQWNM